MIRNFFKERKERKEQEYKESSMRKVQMNKLRQKLLKAMGDERLYDNTYVIYSSEFPNLEFYNMEKFVNAACNVGGLSHIERFYRDNSYAFYIYVKKREDPKYNVGDTAPVSFQFTGREGDLMILGRRYDGKGNYEYLLPTSTGLYWTCLS